MYNEIIKMIFAIPTPAEIIFAVVSGLSIGIALGYLIEVNDIKSFKEFKEYIKKTIKNGK